MDGILIIDKPSGMTSRDVVNIVSRKLNTKKVGHIGTLDPIATGVLVIAVGRATKIIELLMEHEKVYIAEVQMGMMTDTIDITGNILSKVDVDSSIIDKVDNILPKFIGTYLQEVPLYSAVRVDGKRLYEYARKNEKVKLPKRNVNITSINLLNKSKDTFSFSCVVSKGTYIRSLIRDIGNELGIPCIMKNLRRTKIGIFSINNACTIEDIENNKFQMIDIKDALSSYPKVIVEKDIAKKVLNGVKLPKVFDGEFALILDKEENLLGIYTIDKKDNTLMKPWKVFN